MSEIKPFSIAPPRLSAAISTGPVIESEISTGPMSPIVDCSTLHCAQFSELGFCQTSDLESLTSASLRIVESPASILPIAHSSHVPVSDSSPVQTVHRPGNPHTGTPSLRSAKPSTKKSSDSFINSISGGTIIRLISIGIVISIFGGIGDRAASPIPEDRQMDRQGAVS
jgi:hypothetical protein